MSSPAGLRSLLAERILILDGAMGTELQRLELGEDGFRGERFAQHSGALAGNYDVLSLTRPDLVSRVHQAYLAAGSDIIRTNTFGATAIVQAGFGLPSISYELNLAAARLARAACNEWTPRSPRQPRFAAGTIGPTNRSASVPPRDGLPVLREIAFDRLTNAYTEQVRGLTEGGCDLLLIETIFDVRNAEAALAAVAEVELERGWRIPVMLSATVSDPAGRTLAGQSIETFWAAAAPAQPLSVGLNCSSGARSMRPHLATLARIAGCAVSCHPSAGLPDASRQYPEQAAGFAALVHDFAAAGLVNIVGGCCGTTPDHIQAIAEAVRGLPPRAIPGPAHTSRP